MFRRQPVQQPMLIEIETEEAIEDTIKAEGQLRDAKIRRRRAYFWAARLRQTNTINGFSDAIAASILKEGK